MIIACCESNIKIKKCKINTEIKCKSGTEMRKL